MPGPLLRLQRRATAALGKATHHYDEDVSALASFDPVDLFLLRDLELQGAKDAFQKLVSARGQSLAVMSNTYSLPQVDMSNGHP